MIKEVEMVALVFGTDKHGHTTVHREKRIEKAVEWNLRAAEHNHPQAQYNAGVLYMSGEGVKQDFQQAMYWERLARMNALRTSVNIS